MKELISFLILSIFLLTSCNKDEESINPIEFKCGETKVEYSGKTYNTVKIGEQCWLKENLDVGVYVESTDSNSGHSEVTDNGVIEKYCFANDSANCTTYGGLYDWNEAMNYSTTPGVQGICPPNWHIPTIEEFRTLKTTVGGDGNSLKEISQGDPDYGGAGTNTSGFSAFLAGTRKHYGTFFGLGYSTDFWSSSEYDTNIGCSAHLNDYDSVIYLTFAYKDYGFSVRCVKDY